MNNIFVSIYDFFAKRKAVLFIAVALLFSLSLYYSTRINLVEDIFSILSSDRQIDKYRVAFNEFQLLDKVFVTVNWNDPKTEPDRDAMIAYADRLNDGLSRQTGLVKSVTYKFSDETMYKLFSLYMEHMPSFMTEDDYAKIDAMLGEDALKARLQEGYGILMSPASMFYKNVFLRDPIGLLDLARSKLSFVDMGNNFDYYGGCLFSKDGRTMLLFISAANSMNETKNNKLLVAALDRNIADCARQFPGVRAEYYGTVPIAVDNAIRIKSDIILSVNLAAAVIFILMLSSFRNKLNALIVFLPVVIGPSIALALLALWQHSISAISIGIASVLVGISVDFSILISSHFEVKRDMRRVIADVSGGIVLSCITTVAVFMALLFIRIEGMRVMGILAALSMVNICLLSLIVVPHLVKLADNRLAGPTFSPIHAVGGYRFDRNKLLLALIVLMTIACAWYAPKVQFDGNLENLNYLSPKMKHAEATMKKVVQVDFSKVLLISTGKDREEALANSDRLLAKLSDMKQQSIVGNYTSISTLCPSQSTQLKRIEQWKAFWTPERRKLASDRLNAAGKELGFKSKAFAPFFAYLDTPFAPFSLEDIDPSIRDAMINDWMKTGDKGAMVLTLCDDIPAKNKMKAYIELGMIHNLMVVSKKDFVGSILAIIKSDYVTLLVLSIVMVLALLFLYYGRVELAIVSFLPMGISWIWALGLMGMFGMKFNVVNIIGSVFVFGLGTDYSIYILQGLLQEHKYGVKNLNSYKVSVELAVLTTLIGFGVLVIARHPSLRSMGFTSLVGLGAVLLLSYTVEPLLTRVLTGRGEKASFLPRTFGELLITFLTYSTFIAGSLGITLTGIPLYYVLPLPRRAKKYLLHSFIMYFVRSIIYSVWPVKKRIINPLGERLEQPAVIISNHQSLLDILVMLMLHPKVIILSKKWVWDSPIFGLVVRLMDFYCVDMGFEELAKRLEPKIKEGYSVMVFPEGSRSDDREIKRFHKGAFYLAEQLRLDILPIVLHGTDDCIPKGSFVVNRGTITVKYLPRIAPGAREFGETYVERSKAIRAYFTREYDILRSECETPEYFRGMLLKNYLYKGPVLEWYARIKTAMEDNYRMVDALVPKKAAVVDIGCGYGFMAGMLSYLSKDRLVTGIDFDEQKIAVAAHGVWRTDRLSFRAADITESAFEKADVYLLFDVLHYLDYDRQKAVLNACKAGLSSGGKIIIREADSGRTDRHGTTRFIEMLSNGIRFNRSKNNQLYFADRSLIFSLFEASQFDVILKEADAKTSNLIYIITKR